MEAMNQLIELVIEFRKLGVAGAKLSQIEND